MERGWNREQKKWQQTLGEISSFSWRKTKLVANRNATVPSSTGVYVMMAKISSIAGLDDNKAPWNKIYGPFYIGKAKNLNQRFSQHAAMKENNTGILVRTFRPLDFWWVECGENQYSTLEANLIELFRPTFNSVQPLIGQLGDIQKIR